MILRVYQRLIITSFLKIILIVSLVFLLLIFILNIFEEMNFFKDIDKGLYKQSIYLFDIYNSKTAIIIASIIAI